MKTWFIASVCTLVISWLNAWCFNGEGWDAFHYFTATCLFGIFLKIRE